MTAETPEETVPMGAVSLIGEIVAANVGDREPAT